MSLPTMIAQAACASADSNARRMRAPRSPSPCAWRPAPCRRSHSRKKGSLVSGAHHSSTGPSRESLAARRQCTTSLRCNAAAPAAPSAGISRVLASPGAFANTITGQTESAALAVIEARKTRRRGAEEKREAKPRHQQHGAQVPAALPAPARCHRLVRETQRPRNALERARQRDVLHLLERWKASGALEGFAPDEDGLIAGGDSGRARAQVHEKRDHGQADAGAFDAHVEAPPRPAAIRQPL